MFAELRSQAGDDSVVMFEDDHASIHDLLDRAGTDEWASVAEQLVDRLSEHMLLEETDLFPVAHQLLTPDQWARITELAPSR